MDDDAQIVIHPYQPETFVFAFVQLMKANPRIGWVYLQIKNCGFYGFLLVISHSGQDVGESVGDTEVHKIQLFKEVLLFL